MEAQQTIAEPVSLRGRGLFHGKEAEVTFRRPPKTTGSSSGGRIWAMRWCRRWSTTW